MGVFTATAVIVAGIGHNTKVRENACRGGVGGRCSSYLGFGVSLADGGLLYFDAEIERPFCTGIAVEFVIIAIPYGSSFTKGRNTVELIRQGILIEVEGSNPFGSLYIVWP